MTIKSNEVNETLKDSKLVNLKESQEADKDIVLSEDSLSKYSNVGMSKVDPMDILPPQILLIQKTSDLSMMQDTEGKTPKLGQFFHTGKKAIYDTFEGYIVFAGKSEYTNRRQTNPDGSHPILRQYKVIGVMKEDLSMFGMSFRSTAFYALSNLFTISKTQKKPMFAFNVMFENKKISGDKGEWFVPVVRVNELETDNKVLQKLLTIALSFEKKAEEVIGNSENLPWESEEKE